MKQHKQFKKNSVYTFQIRKGRGRTFESVNKLCVLSDKTYACLVEIHGVQRRDGEVGYSIDEKSATLLKKEISENKGVDVSYYGWVDGEGTNYIDASTM